jgi:CHAT domain-containing protein
MKPRSALIVPDGALNLLPFAALPMETTRYVVDAGPTIHYLSAERDLVAPASARVGRGLLAIGGAGYGEIAADDAARDTGRRSGCGTFDSIGFLPLPAALREAQDVAAFWRTLHGGAATEELSLLTGARASEAAFKRLGPGRRHLHVATHGFFLDESCEGRMYGGRGVGRLNRAKSKHPEAAARRQLPDNPLLLSGLALAGANRRFAAKPTDEDGILTAEEVAALDLDGVEWAVLSACNTGIGEIKVGEGVFGLRRAFRVAGARTTIMSLWDVEDRAARAWMRPLYEGRLRDKLSTAEAVRHASLTVLRDRRAKRLNTHPFYWAGFVAAGDWR